VHNTLGDLLEPSLFVGRAPQQVKEFIVDCVDPILTEHAAELSKTGLDAVNV
jgi:adenylosuccinate lyase